MEQMTDYIKREDAINEAICAVYWALNQHGNVNGQVIIDKFNAIPSVHIPQWISAEEKLPEQKGYYLVFAHSVIGTAYYGSKWWTEDPRIYEPQITHWMPMLPEPPKEETDG